MVSISLSALFISAVAIPLSTYDSAQRRQFQISTKHPNLNAFILLTYVFPMKLLHIKYKVKCLEAGS